METNPSLIYVLKFGIIFPKTKYQKAVMVESILIVIIIITIVIIIIIIIIK